ncbi:hypothetical protein KIN20_003814 [Parelaphostrongylus tenuis]|uniref:Uncharacterized protein n=1 Tax=Parelaphostrongylus tenuis TaxID=148309 RepID=A0AAD5MG60_PARTN|nr:hypothetical protein KIN20_003814 [Parelaphostrongylus tenuis]
MSFISSWRKLFAMLGRITNSLLMTPMPEYGGQTSANIGLESSDWKESERDPSCKTPVCNKSLPRKFTFAEETTPPLNMKSHLMTRHTLRSIVYSQAEDGVYLTHS